MKEVVLDASVVLKWFHKEGEAGGGEAQELRAEFEAGNLHVLVPPLLWLEILNVAARRWRWGRVQLEELAAALPELGFEPIDPKLSEVAEWAARGLTAYDAAYVAAAEAAGVPLITDDAEISRIAAEAAEPLIPS